MNLPTYIKDQDQNNFFEELTQTLTDGLSDNGWTIPQITMANLAIISPNMPDGTIYYVTDHAPPCWVGINNGTLVQFTTAAYP